MTTPKRKSVKTKTVKAWCIYNDLGSPFTHSVRSMPSFCKVDWVKTYINFNSPTTWLGWQKAGYTCQPVLIMPAKAKGGK